MYRFNIVSSDGADFEKEYSSLEEFAKEWTNGSLSGYGSDNKFVTNDGISVIRPLDDFTHKEIVKEKEVSHLDYLLSTRSDDPEYSSSHETMLEAVFAPKTRELARLYLTKEMPDLFGNYLDTEKGRAFILDADDPLSEKIMPNQKALSNAGLAPGSMVLKDTYCVLDKMSQKLIVFDTRKEAESITDILPRAIEKSAVINASIELSEGFNDDGLYADVKVFGDKEILSQVKDNLDKGYEGDEHCGYNIEGYSNSKSHPISRYELGQLTGMGPGNFAEKMTMARKEDVKKDGLTHENSFAAIKVTRKLTNACGATEAGIFVEQDGKVDFFREGSILREFDTEDFLERDYKEMDKSEIKECVIATKEQEDNLGMPF